VYLPVVTQVRAFRHLLPPITRVSLLPRRPHANQKGYLTHTARPSYHCAVVAICLLQSACLPAQGDRWRGPDQGTHKTRQGISARHRVRPG